MLGEEKKPSPEGLALLYLRLKRGWSQKELAARLGWADHKQISRYEKGADPLRREQLDICVAPLGFSPEAVDALLLVGSLIAPKAVEEPDSPLALTPKERRRIDRIALAAALRAMEDVRKEMRRAHTHGDPDAESRDSVG
jgi:transcriptional regulator with XRE-family HTH domain